jgi:hypothetical protein
MSSDMENGRPGQDSRSENFTTADTIRLPQDTAHPRQNAIAPELVCCDCWAIAALDALAVAR